MSPVLGLCDTVHVYLLHVVSGASLPQHAEEAGVMFKVLSGKNGAKIGPTKEFWKEVEEGQVLVFPPTAPKYVEARTTTYNCS